MSLTPFRDVAAAAWLDEDVVEVRGPDAVSFLQGQLSQDLGSPAAAAGAWSFLLEPQGKLDALLRVGQPEPDLVVLVMEGGHGPAVVERIERFKLRVDAEIGLVDARVLAVRGPAPSVPDPGTEPGRWVVAADHPGLVGYDLVGPEPTTPAGVGVVDPAWFEAVRIEAGLPRLGRDVAVGALPAETGMVERAVSFAKGCYTGQELVARVDSRGGRAPWHLVGVRVDRPGPAPWPAPPLAVTVDGEEVGVLTSLIGPPHRQPPIGLARVRRAVEVPGLGVVGDGVVVQLTTLPLVS